MKSGTPTLKFWVAYKKQSFFILARCLHLIKDIESNSKNRREADERFRGARTEKRLSAEQRYEEKREKRLVEVGFSNYVS
jgi:hypothetical protein